MTDQANQDTAVVVTPPELDPELRHLNTEAMRPMYCALKVLTLTPRLRGLLKQYDPQGLEQAEAALLLAEDGEGPSPEAVTGLLEVARVALEFVALFTGNGAPCKHWPEWWDHEAVQGDNRNEDRLRAELEGAISRATAASAKPRETTRFYEHLGAYYCRECSEACGDTHHYHTALNNDHLGGVYCCNCGRDDFDNKDAHRPGYAVGGPSDWVYTDVPVGEEAVEAMTNETMRQIRTPDSEREVGELTGGEWQTDLAVVWGENDERICRLVTPEGAMLLDAQDATNRTVANTRVLVAAKALFAAAVKAEYAGALGCRCPDDRWFTCWACKMSEALAVARGETEGGA